MNSLRTLDLIVIAIYFVAVAAIGLRFARRQTSTETYFVARRAIPAWAMGLSMFATIISSITFIAYPGSAYAGNWNELVPGFMVRRRADSGGHDLRFHFSAMRWA